MEKNENEELLEQSPAEIQQEDTQKIAKSGKEEPDTEEQKVSNGRFILWSLAGVYLLYTSYSLCKGYVTGEEGTSMGFMLAGIAFAAIGAGLLFFGIKNMLSEEKIRKAKAAKNAAMEAAAGGELKKEDASGQNRSMSIAESDNMYKNLGRSDSLETTKSYVKEINSSYSRWEQQLPGLTKDSFYKEVQ